MLASLFTLWSCFVLSYGLHEFVSSGDLDTLRAQVQAGADLNQIGSGGQTPLMFAVLSGKENAVKVLLELGADTSIPEKDGYTPLHGAGFQGRYEIAKILMDHGLDPLDRHNDGYAPIHRACWGNQKRHTLTVQAFLDAGVPAVFPTVTGEQPVMLTSNRATKDLLGTYLQKEL